LPLTLGLLATVLSGTAFGAVLSGHLFAAGTILTMAWLAATWRAVCYLQSRSSRAPVGLESIADD